MVSVDPQLTVVIPVWGRYCDYLPQSVASALAQNDVAVRVLVVDNASVRRLPALPEGVVVIRARTKLPVGSARNLGLAHVDTPYVCFLDADDVLLPGALGGLVRELAAEPRRVTACGRAVAWNDTTGETRVLRRAPRPIAVAVSRHRRLFALANLALNAFCVVGCVHRTDAVRSAGGFAEASVGEDWVLGATLCWHGRIRLTERPVFRRRVHEGSLWYRQHDPATLLAAGAALHDRVRRDAVVPLWAKALLPLLAAAHRRSLRWASRRGVVTPDSPVLHGEVEA